MDFSTIKQIVIPEGIVKKIEDGDGNIIWQKQSTPTEITIDYTCLRLNQYLPASKTVQLINNQYTLTAADLPTINLGGNAKDQIVGWTIDGSTQLQVGNTISTNVTLRAIHKLTFTKTYDWSEQPGVIYGSSSSGKLDYDKSHSTTHWNLQTAKSANATRSYKKTWSVTRNTYYYFAISLRGFAGIIGNTQVYPETKFKIHWNPAVKSVTYAATNSYSMDGKYANTYPMILVRDGNTTTKLYTYDNVGSNFVSSTITTGASANGYISFQYGGWASNGTLYGSWARQNRCTTSSFTANKPTSNQTGNKTDYIYLYMQP